MSKAKAWGLKESDFQKTVIDLAEFQGWRVYHVAKVKGQLRSKTGEGFPDLVLARERCLFRELKRESEDPSDDQEIWLMILIAAGEDAKVWRPSDWPEIEKTLKRARRPTRSKGEKPF